MKRVFLTIGITLMLIGCQPEEPQPVEVTTNSASLTCVLNNENWSGVTFNNSFQLNVTDGIDSLKALRIMAKNSEGKQVTLSLILGTNTSLENMPTGSYLSTGTTRASGVQYFENGSSEGTGVSNSSNPGNSEVIISNFNELENTCSGTFSFLLQDHQSGDTVYTATNGQFTSLTYTLIE
jgi:hypothetical protein